VREIELSISAKDREVELLEKNHLVELRVYQQKVKHLEYEHANNVSKIERKNTELLQNELDRFSSVETGILAGKDQLKLEKNEIEQLNAANVLNVKQTNDKAYNRLRGQFEDGIQELTARCESRLRSLERDLELKCRVDEHEVEERKNQHVNELVRNHGKAFKGMKEYYNDITKGNLQLIKQLQRQVEVMKVESSDNKQKIAFYSVENQKLSEPLAKVRAEISTLQLQLKERSKDKMNLTNSRLRLTELHKEEADLRQRLLQAQEAFHKVEKERDELFKSFEEGIQRVKQQSDFQNEALEQRISAAERSANMAAFQVDEIMKSAGLDGREMGVVMSSLNAMLVAKEEEVKRGRFEVIRMKKTYNDTYQTLSARMRQLGIPEEELQQLGFTLQDYAAGSTDAPAGLVALH
jgi:hypothetical protein